MFGHWGEFPPQDVGICRLKTTASELKILMRRENQSPVQDADSSGPDLGFPDDGFGLDLCRLHHGHGRLEDHLDWWHGGLLHHQGGLVLVQPVEILFHRLNRRQQLLRLPHALVRGG